MRTCNARFLKRKEEKLSGNFGTAGLDLAGRGQIQRSQIRYGVLRLVGAGQVNARKP